MKKTKEIFLLVMFIGLSSFASDVDNSAQAQWRPLVYEYLSPSEKYILDKLDYVNSTNFIIIDHLLNDFKTQKCSIQTEYKENKMSLKVLDTVSGEVYSLVLKKDEAKFGLVHKSADFEYVMVVTDTFEDLEGLLVTGSTYSLIIKLSASGDHKGEIADIHVVSSNKTIFDGVLLGLLGEWIGRKPMENGLDFHCSLDPQF